MVRERKLMKKTRIGWVTAASLLVSAIGAGAVMPEAATLPNWRANTVEEVKVQINETVTEEGVYEVQWGDTLSTISLAVDITVSDLADANKIEEIDLIYPGDLFIVDKDVVEELVKTDSYVDYKLTRRDDQGNLIFAEPQKYQSNEDKPSHIHKDLFEKLEKEVEEKAKETGQPVPQPIKRDEPVGTGAGGILSHPMLNRGQKPSTPKASNVVEEGKKEDKIVEDQQDKANDETVIEKEKEDDQKKDNTPTEDKKDNQDVDKEDDKKEDTPEKDKDGGPVEDKDEGKKDKEDDPVIDEDHDKKDDVPEQDKDDDGEDKKDNGPVEDKGEDHDKKDDVPEQDKDDDEEDKKDDNQSPDEEVTPGRDDTVIKGGGEGTTTEDIIDENTVIKNTGGEVIGKDDQGRTETTTTSEETITEVIPGEIIPGEVIPGEVIPGEIIPGEIITEEVPVYDEDGNPLLDEDGNPVVEIIETQLPDTQLPDTQEPDIVLPDEQLPDQTKETVIQTTTTTVEPGVQYIEDDSLELGVEVVDQEGVSGVREERTVSVYIDGELVDSYTEPGNHSEVQDTIIRVGTKKAQVITTKTVSHKTTIPFDEETRHNPELEKGVVNVIQEGQDGFVERHTLETYTDGELTDSEDLGVVNQVDPVNRIIEVGTKEAQAYPIMDEAWGDHAKAKVGDKVVVHDSIDVDMENNTVSRGPDITHEITGSHMNSEIADKSLNEMKQDPDKDQKALNSIIDGDRVYTDKYVNGEKVGTGVYRGLPASDELVQAFNDNQTLDTRLMQELFVGKINEERAKQGLKAIAVSDNEEFHQIVEDRTRVQAEENGYLRGYDIEKGEYYGAHTLPDGRKWNLVFEDGAYVGDELFASAENMAQLAWDGNPYQLVSEEYLANSFYNSWKNSAPHYRAMMGNYDVLSFSAKLGSDYATTDGFFSAIVGSTIFAQKLH